MGSTSNHHHSIQILSRTAIELRIPQRLTQQSLQHIKEPSFLQQPAEPLTIHRQGAG